VAWMLFEVFRSRTPDVQVQYAETMPALNQALLLAAIPVAVAAVRAVVSKVRARRDAKPETRLDPEEITAPSLSHDIASWRESFAALAQEPIQSSASRSLKVLGEGAIDLLHRHPLRLPGGSAMRMLWRRWTVVPEQAEDSPHPALPDRRLARAA
jgi:hypothetical protein